MIDELLQKLGEEVELDEEILANIEECIEKEHFRYITIDGKEVGFFTWVEMWDWRKMKLYIWINNLFILKEYRRMNNLLFLRRFFRKMYPIIHRFYWYRKKRGRYVYAR
jgi:hypothetical protein